LLTFIEKETGGSPTAILALTGVKLAVHRQVVDVGTGVGGGTVGTGVGVFVGVTTGVTVGTAFTVREPVSVQFGPPPEEMQLTVTVENPAGVVLLIVYSRVKKFVLAEPLTGEWLQLQLVMPG